MKRAIILAALVGAVSLTTAGIALANHDEPGPAVEPEFVYGKVSNACVDGQKIDGDIVSGPYNLTFKGDDGTDYPGSVTITVTQGTGGPQFAFVTDQPGHVVTSVYVKGGPYGANHYIYGGNGVAQDDGLHSGWWKDDDGQSGKWYGLSHLCFFTDKR